MARAFTIPPVGKGPITIDGKPIRGVCGYSLTWEVNEIPQLTLDFNVIADEPIGGQAHVYVSERARHGLLALGWTPPADEPEEG